MSAYEFVELLEEGDERVDGACCNQDSRRRGYVMVVEEAHFN